MQRLTSLSSLPQCFTLGLIFPFSGLQLAAGCRVVCWPSSQSGSPWSESLQHEDSDQRQSQSGPWDGACWLQTFLRTNLPPCHQESEECDTEWSGASQLSPGEWIFTRRMLFRYWIMNSHYFALINWNLKLHIFLLTRDDKSGALRSKSLWCNHLRGNFINSLIKRAGDISR